MVNICIECKKSCGLCCWSGKLKPVDGWTAKPIKKRISSGRLIDGYQITACPKFERNERPKPAYIWSAEEEAKLKELLKQKVRRKLIAEVLNKPESTIHNKILLLRRSKLHDK